MIQNTFCHIPGIGEATERRLWDAGFHTWDDLTGRDGARLTARQMAFALRTLEESRQMFARGRVDYFADRLPANQQWRLFAEFRDSTGYLDIETTGMNGDGDEITTIAYYDGRTVRHYVNGQNLEDFVDDVVDCRVLVTYNGKCFDVPFIERFFRIRLNVAQIDLRYVLNSLGFKGGLKRCEKQLGISRGELDGVDGYFAVLLWADYLRGGDRRSLDTLLAYNIEDTINLERLAVDAYNRKLADTPFGDALLIETPAAPANPFTPDTATIERIKASFPFQQYR